MVVGSRSTYLTTRAGYKHWQNKVRTHKHIIISLTVSYRYEYYAESLLIPFETAEKFFNANMFSFSMLPYNWHTRIHDWIMLRLSQWLPHFLNPKLTHWGRDKMVAISQTTFSNGFYWMKLYEFWLKCHWCFFPRVELTIFQHCFR